MSLALTVGPVVAAVVDASLRSRTRASAMARALGEEVEDLRHRWRNHRHVGAAGDFDVFGGHTHFAHLLDLRLGRLRGEDFVEPADTRMGIFFSRSSE